MTIRLLRARHPLFLALIAVSLAVVWPAPIRAAEPPVWKPTTPMNFLPGTWGSATVLADGRVLVTGEACGPGRDGDPHNCAEIFDPATNRWTPAAPSRFAQGDSAAALLGDGRVLTVGNAWGSGPEIYDPVTDTWSSIDPPTKQLFMPHAISLQDGRVAVVGAVTQSSGALVYDGVSDNWTEFYLSGFVDLYDEVGRWMSAPPQVLLDGRVLVLKRSGGAWLFDPGSGIYPSRSGATHAISGSARLNDGRVFVFGGGRSASIYDPTLDEFRFIESEASGGQKYDHPMVTLRPDGRILVVGGTLHGGDTFDGRSGAFYDPTPNAADPWTAAASMNTARGQGQIVALQDGRTLVIGGYVYDYGPPYYSETFHTAEIFGENRAPIADAGPDLSLTCFGAGCLTLATLDASGSAAVDEDPLTYTWRKATTTVTETQDPIPVAIVLPVGVHTFTLTVTDGFGGTSTDTVTITVDAIVGFMENLAICQAEVSSLNAQIGGLQAQITTLQGDLGTANATNAQLSAQIVALQAENQALNGTVAASNAQIAALQIDLAAAGATTAALNAQVADLTTQNAGLASQIAPLQESVSQLVAPGPQVATAIVDVGALIPAAPTTTARNRLLAAQETLTKAGINVAAVDMIMGLNQIKTAVSQLSSAPLVTVDTAPIRQSLSLGVQARLQRAFADVTSLVDSSHANVIAAVNHRGLGDAAHAAGDYFTAIGKYILALKQLVQI